MGELPASVWPVRETTEHFASYADVVSRALGDRVADWTTLNERHVISMLGYAAGVFAPGRTEPASALAAAHHLSLAHGMAGQVIRGNVADARISITHNITAVRPETGSEQDRAAVADWHTVINEIYLGPQIDGRYPDRLLELTRHVSDWSFVRDGDLAITKHPLDAFGLNYYTRYVASSRPRQPRAASDELGLDHMSIVAPVGTRTDIGWTVDAEGFHDQLVWMGQRLGGIPIWVTENGAAYTDPVVEGRVHDARRVDYLRQHLDALCRAKAAGAPI